MANFCTVADIEKFLQVAITDADKIAFCERAIEEATAAIKNYCHQTIEKVENDEIVFDVTTERQSRLFLPELPVLSVASVVENGVALTEDKDYSLGNNGILYRIGRFWARGIRSIAVTYTHGYETLPDDIVAVATRAAARAYQAGLQASSEDAIPNIASKSLGDFSVSYSSGAGGIGEGVAGASAARMLLLSEKDMLNKYRYAGV